MGAISPEGPHNKVFAQFAETFFIICFNRCNKTSLLIVIPVNQHKFLPLKINNIQIIMIFIYYFVLHNTNFNTYLCNVKY